MDDDGNVCSGSRKAAKMFSEFEKNREPILGVLLDRVAWEPVLTLRRAWIPCQSFYLASSCLPHYDQQRHNEEKTCPQDGDLDSQETKTLMV